MSDLDECIAFLYRPRSTRRTVPGARQGREIEARLQSRTGHLLSYRWHGVSGNRLTFTHPDYERFLDMRSGSRKRTRIHNRFTYGAYASIAERLLKGMEEKAEEVLSL